MPAIERLRRPAFRPAIMALGLIGLAVMGGATAMPAVAERCALDLSAPVEQGRLVLGRTDPACRLRVGRRGVRVAPDGRFVFGVGRDARGAIELVLIDPAGRRATVSRPIAERRYAIQRIDGIPKAMVEPPPEIAARIARERAAIAATRTRDDDRADFAAEFVWPVQGRISGVYGSQRIVNGIPRAPHLGLDIAAPTGTPIVAPAPGLVTFTQPDQYLNGGVVVLDHGHGVSSTFIHLHRIDVTVGQRLEQGDPVGQVGATGRATGPHLHWGLHWFDVAVDPWPLLPSSRR